MGLAESQAHLWGLAENQAHLWGLAENQAHLWGSAEKQAHVQHRPGRNAALPPVVGEVTRTEG